MFETNAALRGFIQRFHSILLAGVFRLVRKTAHLVRRTIPNRLLVATRAVATAALASALVFSP
ncbi:MAG: hypothetical protein LJE84_02480, partial [Gammaproteobacteria bacterium]|nr:hypothetical protein [Gammaproteobacteria bacterium]